MEEGLEGYGGRVGAGDEGAEEVADDCAVIDEGGVGGLGGDEVLEEVGMGGVGLGLVGAGEASAEFRGGEAGDMGEVRGAEAEEGVLVEEVVEPGHLAAYS